MKHYMLPRTPIFRETHPAVDLLVSSSPNPTPSHKHRSNRKLRLLKENSDPNSLPDHIIGNYAASPFAPGKPSPANTENLKSPLPPRPPQPPSSSVNPLKRKLSVDNILADVAGPYSFPDTGVKVVVRIRPLRNNEENAKIIVKKLSEDSLTINGQTFTFDSVADLEASQLDIFQLVGAPLVENCLAGFNSSVFAYGQTGSGKTYTMWGPPDALLDENLFSDQQGLTPRVFERLFARIIEEQTKHADKQLSYQCRCSFLEIYNEQITDLLEPSQRNLQIREDLKSGVYVENLTEECVSNLKDIVHLLLKGLANRRTGSTSINADSSRSHSVFTCVVESRCKSRADGLSSFKTSRINLVDLAGSERQKLTGAAGKRLKEACNINRSLSQLGNLINVLAEVSQTGKQRHIPYRDSKLTFLLQESLGGNAKMAMVCAISPAQSCKSETFSTLRFAQRAKAINNKAVVNEVMRDDVNHLREIIRQLKDELVRMKAHEGQMDPNKGYSNGWNARRSLNLLKFSLPHPMVSHHFDDDGDEVMEIDEEAVEKLCFQVSSQPITDANKLECVEPESQCMATTRNRSMHSQVPDSCDVIMGEEIDEKEQNIVGRVDVPGCSRVETTGNGGEFGELVMVNSAYNLTSSSHNVVADVLKERTTVPSNNGTESTAPLNLCMTTPCESSPVLKLPTYSSPPTVISSSRKSPRTSSMQTASQKDTRASDEHLGHLVAEHASVTKSSKQSSPKSPTLRSHSSKTKVSTTENLAASLHRGLEIIDGHIQNSPLERSPCRCSIKREDLKPRWQVEKADVGVQTTAAEDAKSPDKREVVYICSSCKNATPVPLEGVDSSENSNRQLVSPDELTPAAAKSKRTVPKVVEKVLAGAIRREMALEELTAQQTSEIIQLKSLVQQYKHERECNVIIGQIREDKISRLENLMDGVLPSENFNEEELLSLKKEHELLKEKYDNHPEVLDMKHELRIVQNELEKYKNFFDLGERDVLLEEIHDLRTELQYYYTDCSGKSAHQQRQSSVLKLTYNHPSEPSSSSQCPTALNAIIESTGGEQGADEKVEEEERIDWSEMENKWICITDELRADLEASHSTVQKLKQELESNKKHSEDMKEALQLAMEGHARVLEQYADLEEKHMQLLARHRNMQDGIEDVKKAAARAGVSRPESKFINSLAAEITALKAEREKERRQWRDENKVLQCQLRDTAEAVHAAGELLVRLKEAEEAVSTAQKRADKAEEENERTRKQIAKLKRKHEKEVSSLNQIIKNSSQPTKDGIHDSYRYSTMPNDDPECDDHRWKEMTKLDEPSSWFSGYDRCNI